VTVQDVDPETFYSVGRRLFGLAGEMHEAFAVNVTILGETGAMAGSDDAGMAWASSYDVRVSEVLGAVNDPRSRRCPHLRPAQSWRWRRPPRPR
jgi:hypothetical protein